MVVADTHFHVCNDFCDRTTVEYSYSHVHNYFRVTNYEPDDILEHVFNHFYR